MKAFTGVLGLGLLFVASACIAASMTVSDAKLLPDGQPVTLTAKTITYADTGSFYIEEDLRFCGIRVEKASHGLAVGDRANVTGTISTGPDQERFIAATAATKNGSGAISPIAFINGALGGDDWRYDSVSHAGQKGVSSSAGLNNLGLLVAICGKVTYAGSDHFFIDDGSGRHDGSGHTGVKVVATGLIVPSQDTYVRVAGVSSCYQSGGELCSLIRLRSQNDIVYPAASPGLVIFTGDAENDFSTVLHPTLTGKVLNCPDIAPDSSGNIGCLDQPLSTISFNPLSPPVQPSGFNIENVYSAYDCATDALFLGLHVCGDRTAWDADFNGNIVTWPIGTMDGMFADDWFEEYCLSFDVVPFGWFERDFRVNIFSADGGINTHVQFSGPDPTAGLTACAYLAGGPSPSNLVYAPGSAGPRAPTGNEKDIEVKITGIRTKYGLSGGSPSIRLYTTSGAMDDLAEEDLTVQTIPLTCSP
jgi:hypothetical protein